MKTIDKIITKESCQYGAKMGRQNIGTLEDAIGRIYDCYVPFVDGAYDRGAVYWGAPANLRVMYDRGLNFIRFYRGETQLRQSYHVFTDHLDEFVYTRKQADSVWRGWIAEGYTDLRMEWVQDIDCEDFADDLARTETVRSRGSFPH